MPGQENVKLGRLPRSIKAGDWIRVPAGTLVKNLTLGGPARRRRTSYTVRCIARGMFCVDSSGELVSTVLWSGNCNQCHAAAEDDVQKVAPVKPRGSRK